MNDKTLVDEWLEIASCDLDAAQYLFERPHQKQLEIICYLSQQCAEKSLKAYLCANDIMIPKIHEIGVLCLL
ncbi:MAG: HEPN domain-containing protein [Lachnospiraceae bacterium]|nr:HEPN domain-containing protein [Lachnospiraceae bacterium]